MNEQNIKKAYELAVERYAAIGIDVEKVLEQLQGIQLSLHCWQADDVTGFESTGELTGGIQTTGNYPGKARNIDELRADILKAVSLIPGNHRLNLHEIYGDFGGKFVDRDQVEPEHFESWMQWAAENNMKLDFNSTSFSHPKSGDLTLSNPDEGIRNFWIEHTKHCRAIAEEMGKRQGDPCIMNLWVHDGSKDITVNRMKYRALLKDSLDQIFATEYKNKKEDLVVKPERLEYSTDAFRYRHYGRFLEGMVKKAVEIEDEEEKKELIKLLAIQMKKDLNNWNKEGVEDQKIVDDLREYSNGAIDLKVEDLRLGEPRAFNNQRKQNNNQRKQNNQKKKQQH